MHIVILTAGSRGDTQPYIALGRGLMARGHRVTLGAPAMFAPLVESNGVTFAPLNDEFLRVTDTTEGKAGFDLIAKVKPMLRRMMDDAANAANDADLVIYHPKVLGASYVAEKRGKGAVLSLPLPAYTPTSAFTNPILPLQTSIGFVNRLTYGILKLTKAPYLDIINDFRASLGMKKTGRFSDDLLRDDGKHIPVMYPVSTHVVPRPVDYPSDVALTGYWFLDSPDGWSPSHELASFLATGEKPIYVGFGSMMSRDAEAKARMVIDAIQRAGVRAIVASGWGALALKPADLPPTIFVIREAPHDWLFPRMAAVVHHGGSGTTAAGLRAGVPNVIVPFLGDQPFWGQRVHRMGAGPAPIPNKKLTTEALTAAIQAATTDARMRENAARIGAALRAEDGVSNAIEFMRRMGVLA